MVKEGGPHIDTGSGVLVLSLHSVPLIPSNVLFLRRITPEKLRCSIGSRYETPSYRAPQITALSRGQMGEVVTTVPTIGFNVESVTYGNLNFNVWVSSPPPPVLPRSSS